MLKKALGTLMIGLCLLTGMKPVLADTIVENVARSGKLTGGNFFDLVPYAYYNKEEN